MSENANNEEVLPATLAEGETVIPQEKLEDVKEAVKEVLKTEKVEEAPVAAPDVVVVPEATKKQGLGAVGNGAMGVALVEPKPEKKAIPKVEKKEETVAIHSSRNVTWNGVGKVYIGYNIVSKEAADQWLTRSHTRLATPEEVAKEFSK